MALGKAAFGPSGVQAFRHSGLDLLSGGFLALVTLVGLAHRAALSRPVPPDDETLYHEIASNVWKGQLPPPDWSPALGWLYAPFANPWVTPAFAFHTFRAFLCLAAVLLTFLALRRRLPLLPAFAGGLLLAANPNLADIYVPYVASAALVAGALCLAGRTPKAAGLTLALLILGILLRPEFLLVAVLAALPLGRWIRPAPRWFLPALLAIVGVALYTRLVPPLYTFPGGRFYIAFGQHYAWTQHDKGWDADHWRRFREVMDRDFGEAKTLREMVARNPGAVADHVTHNLKLLPGQFLRAIAVGYYFPLNAVVPGAALAGLALVALRRRWGLLRDRLGELAPQLWVGFGLLGLYGPWLLIRPRYDYQFVLTPLVVLLIGAAAAAALSAAEQKKQTVPQGAAVEGGLA